MENKRNFTSEKHLNSLPDMKIGGLEKISLIDYTPYLSCVIFTYGCNFRCPYCHNAQLVIPQKDPALIDEKFVFDFLEKRKKYLDGVVITGGEPTLQRDLAQFATRIKKMGFLVKLDTNGSNPYELGELIRHGLLDFIAMDIKTSPERYANAVGARGGTSEDIVASIKIIIESGLSHEFRSTCVNPIINTEAVKIIAGLVDGAERYALQTAHTNNVLEPTFFSIENRCCTVEEIEAFKRLLSPAVKTCIIR